MVMAFTYDAGQISYEADATDVGKRNAVRFLLRDTKQNRKLFEDEELDTWIAQWANVWIAAANLADMVIGDGLIESKVSVTTEKYLRQMAPVWRNRGKSHQAPIAVSSGRGRGYFTEEGGKYDGDDGYI